MGEGLTTGSVIAKSRVSSDGLIDDDFENELGGLNTSDFGEVEEDEDGLMGSIAEYGIVECGGDDRFGRKIITCSACRLPDEEAIRNSEFRSLAHFYDCLFAYIRRTFDQYVEMDYVIIYFHHGLNSLNRPSYGWLMRAYRHIDRKYKKNLKALYIVHPTIWIQLLWPVLRSIISSKFSSKAVYIDRLGQLADYVYLENLNIPPEVTNIDPVTIPTRKYHVSPETDETVPMVVRQTVDYVKTHGLKEPGIFRRTAPASLIKDVQDRLLAGHPIQFEQYDNVHLAASVLRSFLRDLPDPLLTSRLYPELLGLSALTRYSQIDIIRELILERLPKPNYDTLKYLIEFLNLIGSYCDTNLMTTANLSMVFGSCLAWSDDPQMNTFPNYSSINCLTEILIAHYAELFLK